MRICRAFIAAVIMLNGCQAARDDWTGQSTPDAVTGAAAGAIAGDMAGGFAEQLGPSGQKTTLLMKEDSSEFATALEAALKGWGFEVVTKETDGGNVRPVALTYAVDALDGQVLARISTPTIALGRAYALDAAGATPVSPLSILQRN